jgi:beta-lactamase superfamily II metal-dependent hydrolase
MNVGCEERGAAGINIHWPDVNNAHYIEALGIAEEGGSPNNISPIFTYSLENGATIGWMGDLETEFLENIKDEVKWPKIHILFAPHHGRHSGKIPEDVLEKIDPKIIIIGEAPSKYLNYYQNYNTLTQLSAGHITFECTGNKVHISVATEGYEADFLVKERYVQTDDYYIGTLTV